MVGPLAEAKRRNLREMVGPATKTCTAKGVANSVPNLGGI